MLGENIIFAKHSYGKELVSKICKQLKIQMFINIFNGEKV